MVILSLWIHIDEYKKPKTCSKHQSETTKIFCGVRGSGEQACKNCNTLKSWDINVNRKMMTTSVFTGKKQNFLRILKNLVRLFSSITVPNLVRTYIRK